MRNKLLKDDVERRFFHRFSEKNFFSRLDDILVGPEEFGEYWRISPDTGKREKVMGRHRPSTVGNRLSFCFALGTASSAADHWRYPSELPSHAFRMRAGKWVFGDMMPVCPGTFIEMMPYEDDDDVLVTFMLCSHDGVCDEPAMATLFREGGLSGDVDNLVVIMVYEECPEEIIWELDQLGLLFLCSDNKTAAGVRPYFPIGSLKTTHDSFDRDIRVNAGFPVPLLEEWGEEDLFGAYRIACMAGKLWELDADSVGYELGYTAARLLSGFAMALPEMAHRGSSVGIHMKSPAPMMRTSKEESLDQEEMRFKRGELVRLLQNIHPAYDAALLLRLRAEDDNLHEILGAWSEGMKCFPIQFDPKMLWHLEDAGAVDERAYEIQALGRRLGIGGHDGQDNTAS